jgi:hypothetical protein
MADLHVPLGDEASEEMLHLIVDHTMVSPSQFLRDLCHCPLPVAQAENVGARPVQNGYRLRPQ